MKKPFVGVYQVANLVTYLGVVLSVVGIALAPKYMYVAMICLALAGICDLFDGRFARMCKRTENQKRFGIEIDSLADVTSFLLFPTVILLSLTDYAIYAIVIAAIYVLAGLTRLAWFNITTDGNTKYYEGLPVTYAALILPVCYVVLTKISVLAPYLGYIFAGIFVVVALLFVLRIRMRKPTGVWYGIFSVLAIATIVALIVWR